MSVIGESDIVPSRQPCPHVRFDADGGTSYCSLNPVTTRIVDIVFDGPPGPNADGHHCNFVEAEDLDGRSLRVGEWIDRGDGLWALRLHVADSTGQ